MAKELDPFDQKWNIAVQKAHERCQNDVSLRELRKKYQKLERRMKAINDEALKRSNQIFHQELRKALLSDGRVRAVLIAQAAKCKSCEVGKPGIPPGS